MMSTPSLILNSPKNGETPGLKSPEKPSQTTPESNPVSKPTETVAPQMLTVPEIEQKAELLNSLFVKRSRLMASKSKLAKFNYTSDDSNTTFQFADTSGNSFFTSNKDVLHSLMKVVADSIANQIIEVDSQIRKVYEG